MRWRYFRNKNVFLCSYVKAKCCFVQTLDEILEQTKIRLEQSWILLFFRTPLLRQLPRSNFLFQILLWKTSRFVAERTIRVVHIDNLIFFSIDPCLAPASLLQTLAFDLKWDFFDWLLTVFAYPFLCSFFAHVEFSFVRGFGECLCSLYLCKGKWSVGWRDCYEETWDLYNWERSLRKSRTNSSWTTTRVSFVCSYAVKMW